MEPVTGATAAGRGGHAQQRGRYGIDGGYAGLAVFGVIEAGLAGTVAWSARRRRPAVAALDFLSTHVYGNVPLDLRPVLRAFGRDETPIWWTEWGPSPTHFHHVGDTVFAAAFLLRGMASALGRIEALSHWVVCDHFEELGVPPEQWAALGRLNTLDELGPPERVTAGGDGVLEFTFDLPMPGVSCLELVP